MPCLHLAQIQQLHLPVSNSDVLKVICPVCGNVDVCAYTPLADTDPDTDPDTDLNAEDETRQRAGLANNPTGD